MPTVGIMNYRAVECLASAVASNAVQAMCMVPRLPVHQARTRLVERCDTTHLLMVDDDMIYTPEHIEMLKQNADKDFICGLAYSRTDKESRGVVMKWDDERGHFVFDKRFQYGQPVPKVVLPVDGGTLSFALIKMSLFDKIGKDFNFGTNPNRGEDVDFFERCRKAGVQIYIDPRVRVGHLTEKIL